MDERRDGEIPSGASRRHQAEEQLDPVVVDRRDEEGCRAARPQDVRPCPLVEVVVDVIYVTADSVQSSSTTTTQSDQRDPIKRTSRRKSDHRSKQLERVRKR